MVDDNPDRTSVLADAVDNIESRARVHEMLLVHILRSHFLQNTDPVNALRLISEELLKTIDTGHDTQTRSEKIRLALDKIMRDVQKMLEANDV
jgi:hypothetical protein